jgi:glycosyltransferase involved in cell wall biosynthesis
VKRRVVILNRVVCDYRVAFYRALGRRLGAAGLELEVIGGAPWAGEGLVDAIDSVAFGRRLRNRHWIGPAYWSDGVLESARGAELVVLEQANGALHNFPLLSRRALGLRGPRLAYFGHGAKLNTARPQPLRDSWKAALATRVDWWFAYTDLSARIVERYGFPAERISVVRNATDTASLREARARLEPAALNALAEKLFGTGEDVAGPTGVFCGRLSSLKWIPLLLQSLESIRSQVPGFRAVLVGDGPERQRVRAFAAKHSWCAWVGALHGSERVPYLALGDLWLNPGMLGLAVVDALALGIPVATTRNAIHSPEIEYLEHDRNGLLTAPDPDTFASAVAALLRDPARLAALRSGARDDGASFSAEDMAERFSRGVTACLDHSGAPS